MTDEEYFFCGVGGSGMLPLAMYLKASGAEVSGSDRAFDQGRLLELKASIEAAGITLFPQDGSGLTKWSQKLVTSSAVEAEIPDVLAADTVGADKMIRAQVLALLTNSAGNACGIAGTSGKSTTTAMLAHILVKTGHDPSVVNGARMLNILDQDGKPQGWRKGASDLFVCEVDESDGSIELYSPRIGVILNISEDHKLLEELEELFKGYAERSQMVVAGTDSELVDKIVKSHPGRNWVTFGKSTDADFRIQNVQTSETGLSASMTVRGTGAVPLTMPLIGEFNLQNALAAIAAAEALGVPPGEAASALSDFKGSARRLQTVGKASGVTVVDDFAHNPEKIAASISALTHHYKRITLLYQPHGYGPLRSGRPLYEAAFEKTLRRKDRLYITEPVYFGGTVTKSDDAQVLADQLNKSGRDAQFLEHRDGLLPLLAEVGAEEALVIMGARDDTLTTFAHDVLKKLTSLA